MDGPSLVEARIENDQLISQQFTLWQGAGSVIIREQLLVIPVADAIIYVEPLYLQSEVLAFPELKKVILADRGNVVMADSVAEGLAMLLEGPGLVELDRIEDAVTGLDEVVKELQESVERLRESLGEFSGGDSQ